MLFYVLFVCKCVLPPGDNPIAVNKYIISYISNIYNIYSTIYMYTVLKCYNKIHIHILVILPIYENYSMKLTSAECTVEKS